MVCLAGIKDLNLLLFWTLAAVVALVSFWSLVKHCAVFCCCCYVVVGYVAVFVVVVVVVVVGFIVAVVIVFFLFVYCTSALSVWFFAVMYVTFSALLVGFCIPLCRVL